MGVRIGGRQKGTPNKHTATVREAVAKFSSGTVKEVLAMWRGLAASENEATRARAIELWARIAALVIPRPTEVTGENGGPIVVKFPPIPGA